MIQTQTQLNDFLDSIQYETKLAIDTEFKRINTYYPLLCLVQIATSSNTDCIDMLAIKDPQPLFDKLYQNNCLWIVHSARQDIEALYQHSKQVPKHLFDTQIAANLLSHPIQISYQALTEILQNVHLEKAHTRLDWTTRPLPSAAIEYALDDVRYLLKNYHQLHAQLKAQNKLDWIAEESESLLNPKLYIVDINKAWKRVKGFSRLDKKYQLFAAQLAAWREHQAAIKNKPRKWIMDDEKLINYVLNKEKLSVKAKTAFSSFMFEHPHLNSLTISINHKIVTKAEKTAKSILQKLIQKIANQYNLPTEVLTNSKSLLNYVRGDRDRGVIFCQGWRYKILKKELDNAK